MLKKLKEERKKLKEFKMGKRDEGEKAREEKKNNFFKDNFKK